MPNNLIGHLLAALFLGIWILVLVRILVKAIRNKFAPIRTVPAVVLGKQTVHSFSKYTGNGRHEKYAVIFSIEGKKKSFYVSKFSYDGYKVNGKGTLTYKGDRIIRFQ